MRPGSINQWRPPCCVEFQVMIKDLLHNGDILLHIHLNVHISFPNCMMAVQSHGVYTCVLIFVWINVPFQNCSNQASWMISFGFAVMLSKEYKGKT